MTPQFFSKPQLLQCDFCAGDLLDSRWQTLAHTIVKILMSLHLTIPFSELFSNTTAKKHTHHSTLRVIVTVHTQVTCLLVRYRQVMAMIQKSLTWYVNKLYFVLCHIYRQSVGNRQLANICTSILLPRCGKYPQATNIRQMYQSQEWSFTIIISTILRPLKEVPQVVGMTPLRCFALGLLYSSPAQALAANDGHHCQHTREDNG